MARKESFNVGGNLNFTQFSSMNEPQEQKERVVEQKKEVEEPKVVVAEEVVVEKAITTPAKPKEVVAKKKTPTNTTEESPAFSFRGKERRNVHKNFLLTESLFNRLKETAEKHGVSTNEVVNTLLEQGLDNLK